MDTLQQITAKDIAGWDSLSDVASTFEKRGLKVRDNFGDDNELVLQLTDREFIVLVEAGPGESASDFKPDDRRRRTNLVATNDYEEFTFLTRIRALDGQQHGRIKHQKLSFTKEQMTSETGEKNTILQKLNSLEFGSAAAIYDDLYDTKQVVKEFYQQFETLRTDLVQEVAGIPDDRGDAKQRYVQVTLDRMIFLYFIQEKRLLDRDPNYLHDHHKQRVDEGENVYEEFYEPLFFDYLAENKKSTEFGALPYLNGGLFSKNPIEEEFEDARLGDTTKRTNELFGDILDFLSDWNWNVDERLDIVDPKNLSPAILGHIFEQTVNQKEMGAYYTPEEMTGFMSRRTIHPYLLDQLNEEVGAGYEKIDDIFGFPALDADSGVEALADGGAVTTQVPTENVETRHVEALYHDFLKEARVLDPAVGSGAFLLAAQEVLLDIYMQCIEFFQQLRDEGKAWELEERTIEELERIEGGQGNTSLYAKQSIILNNLYGVDIDEGAVEICKLRLWLSMVADIEDEPNEVEPLPNIDFNIREGNTLMGFTDLVEINDDGDASLSNWGGGAGEGVRDMYEDVIEAVNAHRRASSSSEAANARRRAEKLIEEHKQKLNEKILDRFQDADISEINLDNLEQFKPFHWVLEFAVVYESGGFDILIGNPPWRALTPDRNRYFTQFDPGFRTLPANEKETRIEELCEDEEIAQGWQEHEEDIDRLRAYYSENQDYVLQSPEVGGQGTTDLSMLFLERAFQLNSDEGYTTFVLPGKLFTGMSSGDIREHLLSETRLDYIIGFENKGIFDIDDRYKFGIVSFKNSGTTDQLRAKFLQRDLSVLEDTDSLLSIPAEVLRNYSPRATIFPQISSSRELSVMNTLVNHPPISQEISNRWDIDIYGEELHRTRDSEYFVESPEEGDYPVYGGGNFWLFEYDNTFLDDLSDIEYWGVDETRNDTPSAKSRVRGKNEKRLKKAIYEAFDGTGSQIGFVNDLLERHRGEGLKEDDVLLDCTAHRIAFRDVSNNTNERSMVAAILPRGAVCHNKAPTIRPYKIDPEEEHLSEENLHDMYVRKFTDQELFAVLGLLNSIPFDYIVRTKLDTTMSVNAIEESQAPRLSEEDNWFNYIAERSARLNAYGDEFADVRKEMGDIDPATQESARDEIQAEIDAAAFHAYGFERRDVEFVLENFHRVSSPRIMTEEYFDMVFEKFDLLAEEGPFK
ncbi:type II restriction endonuclease subunit M (plasmid) [Haloarcula taiwanensis]|uniref:site-specific DNA-methyltransferase (adenine-specific) n=1 Tax=Haloarcula taiwanensis TaxID=1932004 RepID=A0A2H5A3Y2_9EURY|nr:DNA methyltransferase [Haloarcula taiwanensis]AUG49456.1 type II restriction endonuclease subunit M [Haloarcula taiwanensis]